VLIAIVTDSYTKLFRMTVPPLSFGRIDWILAEMDAITYGINTRLGYCRRQGRGGTVTEVEQEVRTVPTYSREHVGEKQPFRRGLEIGHVSLY
jgi:hypothetical protein